MGRERADGCTGFRVAAGAVVVVGAALVAAGVFTPDERPGRVLVMAGVVGAYAAVVADLRAVAAVAALGAAVFVGFLAHRYGELTGSGDAWSQAVPIGFAAVLGTGYRHLRSIGAEARPVTRITAHGGGVKSASRNRRRA